MRYRLRTLMILMAVGPPMLAGMTRIEYLDWRVHGGTMREIATGQISTFKSAVRMYSLHMGQLPPDLDALMVPPDENGNPPKWAGPYVENQDKLPDDPWNRAYHYELLDAQRGRFRIWSKGPDGKSRTKDDLVAER